MKVLLVNGSPHAKGNTSIALNEMIKVFEASEVETELIHIGNKVIRGCIACGNCFKLGRCVFNDVVNEVAPKFNEADGLVVGTPVYYSAPNATVLAFLNRLFFSTPFDFALSIAAVACTSAFAAASLSPLSTAARTFLTAVFTPLLTALLRAAAFSLVRILFFCDLLLARLFPSLFAFLLHRRFYSRQHHSGFQQPCQHFPPSFDRHVFVAEQAKACRSGAKCLRPTPTAA